MPSSAIPSSSAPAGSSSPTTCSGPGSRSSSKRKSLSQQRCGPLKNAHWLRVFKVPVPFPTRGRHPPGSAVGNAHSLPSLRGPVPLSNAARHHLTAQLETGTGSESSRCLSPFPTKRSPTRPAPPPESVGTPAPILPILYDRPPLLSPILSEWSSISRPPLFPNPILPLPPQNTFPDQTTPARIRRPTKPLVFPTISAISPPTTPLRKPCANRAQNRTPARVRDFDAPPSRRPSLPFQTTYPAGLRRPL